MWLKHSRFPVSRYVVSTTCLLFQSPGGSVPHCSRRIIALQQLHDEADYKYLLLCGQPFRFYSCQHVIYLNNTSTVYWITGLLLRSYFIRFVYFKWLLVVLIGWCVCDLLIRYSMTYSPICNRYGWSVSLVRITMVWTSNSLSFLFLVFFLHLFWI